MFRPCALQVFPAVMSETMAGNVRAAARPRLTARLGRRASGTRLAPARLVAPQKETPAPFSLAPPYGCAPPSCASLRRARARLSPSLTYTPGMHFLGPSQKMHERKQLGKGARKNRGLSLGIPPSAKKPAASAFRAYRFFLRCQIQQGSALCHSPASLGLSLAVAFTRGCVENTKQKIGYKRVPLWRIALEFAINPSKREAGT